MRHGLSWVIGYVQETNTAPVNRNNMFVGKDSSRYFMSSCPSQGCGGYDGKDTERFPLRDGNQNRKISFSEEFDSLF